ncbi:MAG: TonB-dependent siderophore receptor [Nitrospina sp.]|nr:TonB-dependent siderophore receptor [Nitrospina sp.]
MDGIGRKFMALVGLFVCFSFGTGQASATELDFNIAPQSLNSALVAFGEKSDLNILYDSGLTQGLTSRGVRQTTDPETALTLLLSGTGLTFKPGGKNSLTLEKIPHGKTYLSIRPVDDPPESARPAASKTRKAEQELLAHDLLVAENVVDSDKKITLPEVRVFDKVDPNAPSNISYTRTESATASKTSMPIIKTPMAIHVMPKAVMDDQVALQPLDVVRNVSGVFQGFAFGGLGQGFLIRGFDAGFSGLYRDGFRFPLNAQLSLANVERVEVVKGPSTNLYGRIEPGGMINMVTKRPREEAYYSLSQQFGSYDRYQTQFDATGALNESGTLLYRFNTEILEQESFRDFYFHDRVLAAPSLTWKITPRTQLDVDFTYSNEDTREDYGLVALGNRPAPIPRSRFLQEPLDETEQVMYNTTALLTHNFTPDWQVRARFNHMHRFTDDPQTGPFALDETTGVLQRGFYDGVSRSTTYQASVDVNGRFDTAGVEHNVLVGWDFYNDSAGVTSVTDTAGSINIFNPQYENVDRSLQPYNFFISQTNRWNGVYFQDQITLFDKLHIMGGGRYDWALRNLGLAFGANQSLAAAEAASMDVYNERFSPRAGILFQPWEWLSLYGNWVKSLGSPNGSFDASGNILDPEIAEQYEGGFKTSFFNGRLNSTVAFYHLTKENVAVPVPGTAFSNAIGEARSQGVEVDVSGQVTDDLSLILTYAYTDAEITQGTNQGNRLWNVPRNAGSLWVRYDLPEEWVRGLTVGAGLYVQGERPGDNANSYFLPAQTQVDAMLRYRPEFIDPHLTLQLNVNNLADETLYGGTLGDRFTINVNNPRTFTGTVRYALW